MSPLVLFAIKALIATGAIAAAGRYVAGTLPPIHAHTSSAKLNVVIDTIGNAAEGVVKTMLNGPMLVQVATAVANGQPVAGPLTAQLPDLKAAVLAQVGPAVQAALAEALGSQDAADKRLETEVLVAAHAHSEKLITTLPSGLRVVSIAPQAI